MIKLLIDGQRVDLGVGFHLPQEVIKMDLDRHANLAVLRKGHSVEIEIPSSRVNDRVLCYPADTKAAERFNESYHEAQIEVDGTTLMRGVVHLVACSADKNGAESYRLRIYQGGDDWVESLARHTLDQTEIEYSASFDGESVERSWSEDVAVRFLPIHYDSYLKVEDQESLLAPLQVANLDIYYPFLSVSKFVKAMFAQAGYEVKSQLFDSEEFGRLMMSGKFATMDEVKQSRLAAYTGFEAGRSNIALAKANSEGRVWLSKTILQNSLGNFVTTTSGAGLYNSGDVLTISDEEGMVYHPKSTQLVGFEYEFHYKTEYSILSREHLQGFNSIYLDSGVEFTFEMKNTLKDCREELRSNMYYSCCIFDFQEGEVFRLIYTEGETQKLLQTIYQRIETITTPYISGDYTLSLQVLDAEENVFIPYTGDWAMYENYVMLTGEMEVAVKLRTPAEVITPATGKSFNHIYIHGAAEEQRITLLEDCRLRAIFSSTPTLGTSLSLQDVTPKDVTQLELLEALGQMFNLRFITSDAERRVYIEPLCEMIGQKVVDWRERVVKSDSVVIRDLAEGLSRERLLTYRAETDGAVGRFNEENEGDFGEWKYQMKSYISTPSRNKIANPLFSPTLTAKTNAECPSAWIMQVGDRDADIQSITMRIVSYRGLKPLPQGEVWGYPSFSGSYPYATFHDTDFTLCFEDRDGVEGLHRYYDAEWREQDESYSLEVSVKIKPHELEQLSNAAQASETFGLLYLLNISGESALYRLQAVEAYNAERAVARCLFYRMLRD